MDSSVGRPALEKKNSKIRYLNFTADDTPFAMTLLQAISPSTKLGDLSMKQPIKHYLAVAPAGAGTHKTK